MPSDQDELKPEGETLKPSPVFLVELIEPNKLDDYKRDRNIPVPVLLKTPNGVCLNDMLPEDSGIFLCQTGTACDLARNRGANGSLVIETKSLSTSEEFLGLDDRGLEGIATIMFDISLIKNGRSAELESLIPLFYKDFRSYWFDHPEERENHRLPKTHSIQYVANANRYGGLYSTALAQAIALSKELGLEEDLIKRMRNYYNAQLADVYATMTEKLKDLVIFAHPPDETGIVRVFNPRTGKYIEPRWQWMDSDLKDPAVGVKATKSRPEGMTPANNSTINKEDNGNMDPLTIRLTRIYEARFPDDPLGFEVEHTGRFVAFDGLVGGEEVIIKTSDGSTILNEFLPPGMKLVDRHHPLNHFFFYNADEPERRHVVIDLKYVHEKDIPTKVTLTTIAHEIGHARTMQHGNPEALTKTETEAMLSYFIDKEKLGLPIPTNIVNRGVVLFSRQMEDEVNAWNEGKLVATACGIDDAYYEWEESYSLGSYYYANMGRINQLLIRGEGVIDSDEFEVYNPYSQESVLMTVSEIRQLVESLEFGSRSRTLNGVVEKIMPSL